VDFICLQRDLSSRGYDLVVEPYIVDNEPCTSGLVVRTPEGIEDIRNIGPVIELAYTHARTVWDKPSHIPMTFDMESYTAYRDGKTLRGLKITVRELDISD